jgi:SAM-dependent methyltransferase
MAEWNDGYVTDVTYSAAYHRETSPAWLALSATLLGLDCPDLTRPIRFADLGCGNGVTALIVAATMPHAEVWGFDFNPAHVEIGRDLARRAGLTNVYFEETSFDDLARLPPNALPMFDYISAHGVLSWISLENRRRLFDVIGQRLSPGGIAYMSYNVPTGWTGMPPVRVLMRLLTEASQERTDIAAGSVFDILERMKNAGAAMFQVHPAIDQRLSRMRGLEQRYVAHELLNRDWYPVMFQSVATSMAEIKCDYIGSATLQENIAALTVPSALHAMLGAERDALSRETLRDIASGTPFRRDLYQRGSRRLSTTEFDRRTDAIGLVRTFIAVPDPFVMTSLLGPFTASEPIYRKLLDALSDGPRTIGQLRQSDPMFGGNPNGVREAATILLNAGLLAPILPGGSDPAAIAAAARLNQIHAAMFDDGLDLPFLAYPALCSAWHSDPLDILALDELRAHPGMDEATLAEAVSERLTRHGRQLHQNGQPLTDPVAVRARAAELIGDFIRQRLPLMRELGALEDPPAMAEAV